MYRVSLYGVSAENEAYRDSLVNWLRFNHKDGFNAAVYVGLCAVLLGLAWLGNDIAGHVLATHPAVLHHPTGTLPPMKHNPLPTFKPPDLSGG